MKKLDLAVSSTSPYFIGILFVLMVNCSVGSLAQSATLPPTAAEPDVKNGAARQLVSDSLRAFRSGNRGLGITLLRRAEKVAPQEGWTHFLLGRALLQSYDAASAERQLRQARQNGISDEFVLPSLFDAMIKRHEENKLLDEFPAPAKDATGKLSAEILKGRAMAMLSLGRIDDAAASMDRALSLAKNSDSLLARAKIALRQNNPSFGTKLINEALQRAPRNGHVLLAKLDDLMRSNNDSAAIALSEKILGQFPDDIQTRAAKIDIFLKNNQDAKAKAELGILQARVPKAPIVQYFQAVFLARANKPDAAWKIAQALPPNFALAKPPYIVQLSQMAIKSNHVEAGAAILAKALAYSPDQADLRLRLARIRMIQNNPHSMLLILGPIKDSDNPVALDLLGWAKLRTNDTKGGLDALNRAHSIQPQNGQITFHLVQALNESGDRIAAKELLQKLLASGHSFDDLASARQLANDLR